MPSLSEQGRVGRRKLWSFNWAPIIVFALIVAAFGGTSRPDAAQIAALRPLAALLLIPALYLMTKDAVRPVRLPLLLLGGTAVWIAVQLIPLPPSVWQALPDRDIIAELDLLGAGQEVWRPISLVPTRGYNSLAGLVVPAAAIAVALAARLQARDLLIAVAILGAADALLGFAQMLTGTSGTFHTYPTSNRGAVVGLFANDNHSSVFSSVVMVVAARLVLNQQWCRELPWLRIFGAATFVVAMLAAIVGGSRAGLATALVALACTSVMAYAVASAQARNTPRRSNNSPAKNNGRFWQRLPIGSGSNPLKLVTGGVVFLLILAALFVLNGKVAGLEDALNQTGTDDLRWQLIPILQTMVGSHWLLGTGFGSFEEVYHIYEPTELLLSLYLNHAHNDWAQLAIEGGLPALSLLAVLLIWITRRMITVWRSNQQPVVAAVSWVAVLAIMMAASVPDYPLRIPMFQVVAVWLILALALEGRVRPERITGA